MQKIINCMDILDTWNNANCDLLNFKHFQEMYLIKIAEFGIVKAFESIFNKCWWGSQLFNKK